MTDDPLNRPTCDDCGNPIRWSRSEEYCRTCYTEQAEDDEGSSGQSVEQNVYRDAIRESFEIEAGEFVEDLRDGIRESLGSIDVDGIDFTTYHAVCPDCGGEVEKPDDGYHRRPYRCEDCGQRFAQGELAVEKNGEPTEDDDD